MKSKRILVVDDEPQIGGVLRALLEREGFDVLEATNGREMWNYLRENEISLITLDLNLGQEDGFTLAREIRNQLDIPIIMISGKADDIDRIVGLELGADDYITKPFNLREVLARIRAVLRRYEPRPVVAAGANEEAEGIFRFDGWRIDVPGRDATRGDGERVDLTTAEFNLLTIFIERPKRVLSRDVLLDLLKGNEWSPLDRSIDTLIGRLRRKIEVDHDHPSLIKTVRGVGYVFTADVTRG